MRGVQSSSKSSGSYLLRLISFATTFLMSQLADLLHWIEAESRASHESLSSCICFCTAGTPSAEVFLWTDSPLVISILSWISFSCRAVSKAWSNKHSKIGNQTANWLWLNIEECFIPPAWSFGYREHFCQRWERSMSVAYGWCQQPSSAALLSPGRNAGALWRFGQYVTPSPAHPKLTKGYFSQKTKQLFIDVD